jgi:sulfur carrier protein
LKVTVNGKEMTLSSGKTLLEFMKEREIPVDVVVVEKNGEIERDYTLPLKEGDRIEIIRLVGGG